MPAIKSRIKTVRKDAERYEATKSTRSALRTAKNRFNKQLEENNIDAAETALESVFSTLDVAVRDNVIHKNKAARDKSKFTKRLNEAKAS